MPIGLSLEDAESVRVEDIAKARWLLWQFRGGLIDRHRGRTEVDMHVPIATLIDKLCLYLNVGGETCADKMMRTLLLRPPGEEVPPLTLSPEKH